MRNSPVLYWLPEPTDWRNRLRAAETWSDLVALANLRLDFAKTNALDTVLRARFPGPPADAAGKPIRLALLGSSTTAHLAAGIRIAALRRGLHVVIYEGDYGQYFRELSQPSQSLVDFEPTMVLLALDAYHLTSGLSPSADAREADRFLREAQDTIAHCWKAARDHFKCPVLQQTALPVLPPTLGLNEARLPGSRSAMLDRINAWFRSASEAHGVDLVALDAFAARSGYDSWHDRGLWNRAKQEIIPSAGPMYGDLVGRLLAAKVGRSAKCLVLDLDNTVWGGVVGDDGPDGIVIGNGSPLGEAHLSVQRYAIDLAARGVVLAVCSKNDEANALEPFRSNPDMLLREKHLSGFAANWGDKPNNICQIAHSLALGLDSFVFLDDNPFERNLVRQELPMVAVPEVGEDPADYVQTLVDAGYFEATSITAEDRARTDQYQANMARDSLKARTTDLSSYLDKLEMRLTAGRIGGGGITRAHQLINKTNQFNLTTRRYSEDEVRATSNDDNALALQFRLVDRFGDNGVIGIVIGRREGTALNLDTWLMSCRVLGREVESATLNVVASQAEKLGVDHLIGEYVPTAKNGMVKNFFSDMGFQLLNDDGGKTRWRLAFSRIPT
uniref:HAD-IIIC family phosphatase n=1 Tax=Methylobacterium sp. B34 TaxID=95563 RepID=UPI00034DF313|nr:HAD-IIIC family phosphatase [Methylobacterium sp. B34]